MKKEKVEKPGAWRMESVTLDVAVNPHESCEAAAERCGPTGWVTYAIKPTALNLGRVANRLCDVPWLRSGVKLITVKYDVRVTEPMCTWGVLCKRMGETYSPLYRVKLATGNLPERILWRGYTYEKDPAGVVVNNCIAYRSEARTDPWQPALDEVFVVGTDAARGLMLSLTRE